MSDPREELRRALDALDRAEPGARAEAAALMKGWLAGEAGRAAGAAQAAAGGDEPPGRFGLIGAAPAMLRVFDLLARVVRTDVPVLILGESGTGKELVARALHASGPRRKGPFMAVNCAAIPGTLLDAELFGHVRGSFTGAHRDRDGYAVGADGGTLFLDEVGEIPLDLQSKLLRFLQEGEVRPVGANATRKVDVRVVAATNRDLLGEARAKRFREDLYYRLAVITIAMPSLRERREDVPHLVRHLMARQAADGLPCARVAPAALAALTAFDWPGNVRQLQNELVRAATFAADGEIGLDELSAEVRAAAR
jgi:DNA-binding NtrC family response regulator